ncbi:unnamed protein product [Candidula unifasciata]|uniref:EGF-like domain-containing protein n=1 Tax=Candidula unifasciata TaxID=100452 RepID=A0A8S3ZTE7_9EUPU|nr:unnamed protein product [Candidula unifasciata]
MHQDNRRLLLSVLLAYLLHLSNGCGRTPARTKPASPTASPQEPTTPLPQAPTTLPVTGGRQECTHEESRDVACLHGGECFVMDLLDTRNAFCQCQEMWRGNRCEEIDENIYVITADKVEKASIAAGVVVLVIVITVIIVYLVVRKRKQRKNRTQSNGNANGHAGKALMEPEKEPMDSEDTEKCTDV